MYFKVVKTLANFRYFTINCIFEKCVCIYLAKNAGFDFSNFDTVLFLLKNAQKPR